MKVPRRSLAREAGFLLLLALAPALLATWLHPRRPAWAWEKPAVGQVTVAEVTRWRADVLWVDARDATAYAEQHVPGAVQLNENEWERLLPVFLEAWRPDRRVVVYCNSERCQASEDVARRLQRELNLTDVFVLQGGWTAWRQNAR